jgi:antitoxin component YwqK of YwqJK toxin-antitoxin module
MTGKVNSITLYILAVLLSLSAGCAEVTRKAMLSPDGTVEYVFYMDGGEIAQQKEDEYGNILHTNGKIPDGTVKGYDESGRLEYECNYKDNKLEGVSRVYYESGKLMKEWGYKNNKLNGLTKWFSENGTLLRQFSYKDGIRDGMTRKFYENGEIWSIKTYKNGKLINRKEYDTEGNLTTDLEFPAP